MGNKRNEFDKILKGIKEIKIQGARNVAKKALDAYSLFPTEKSKEMLLSSRPTEPMMWKVLDLERKFSHREILKKLGSHQEKINKNVFNIINNGDVIYTHCHSTTVVDALIYAKEHGKKFEVYNTETRPLFQGRRTFLQLKKADVRVTHFVDSSVEVIMNGRQGFKKPDKFLIGADALQKGGIINKIGSGLFAQIACLKKIPVYILSDSWKFSKKEVKLEKRKSEEVWKLKIKGTKQKVENPAFGFVDKENITKIISELGIKTYDSFLKGLNFKSL